MRGFELLVEKLRRSSVQILNRGGGGSGVVWDSAGRIVTNSHVMRGDEANVIDGDGRRLRARIIRRDQSRDLALLETNTSLNAAVIGDSDSVRAGQFVIATGNPLGVPGAVAAGTIHATGQNGFGFSGSWIQADIRLAPGNSGGMLADAEGRVIGVNTMIFQGLGLAIPSNDVAAFVKGEANRTRLGIEMIPAPEGLVVIKVEKDSVAERAGMMIGDILRCTPNELRSLSNIPIVRGGKATMVRIRDVKEEARAA